MSDDELETEPKDNIELPNQEKKDDVNLISAGETNNMDLNEINEEEVFKLAEGQDSKYKEKTCSMKEGSIQQSVFSLSSIALGTGAFSLPIRCSQVGCFWYCIAIILGGVAAYWTLSRLIESAKTVKAEEYSTSVKKIIGKIPAIIIDIVLMIYIYGVIIQFNVIIYSLIGRAILEIFGDKDKYPDFNSFQKDIWNLYYIKFPVMFGLTFLLSPICLLKDISKMRFVSLFGICSLMYSILVIIIQSPWFYIDYKNNIYQENDPTTHANWFDISKGFTSELNFFTAIATVFFVYTCHTGVFPVYKGLNNKTEKTVNTVFFRSILLDLIIYLSIAICGFITDPITPEPLIIFRKSIFKNDIFMNIAKIALALDLYLCIPANYNSLRASFFILVFNTSDIETGKNIIVTYSVMLSATFIAAIFEDILSYISLLGGFFCSIIFFLVPGALMVLTSKEKVSSPKNIFRIIIISILIIIGFTAGVLTVIRLLSKNNS